MTLTLREFSSDDELIVKLRTMTKEKTATGAVSVVLRDYIRVKGTLDQAIAELRTAQKYLTSIQVMQQTLDNKENRYRVAVDEVKEAKKSLEEAIEQSKQENYDS